MQTIKDISLIKTGHTLLVSSDTFIGRTIQEFEKCKWNHAGMFYWCYDELMVIEADKPGVVMTPFADYIRGKSGLAVGIPDFEIDGSEYGKFFLPFLGKTRYGYFDLIIAQPIYILSGKRLWIGTGKENKRKFICGEFVSMIYNHFQPDLFPEWERAAPSDIFRNRHFYWFEFKR